MELLSLKKKQIITAGVITDIQKIITSKGEPMLFVKVEDNLAGLEVLVFPKLYQQLAEMIAEEKVILIKGTLSEKDAEPKVLSEHAGNVFDYDTAVDAAAEQLAKLGSEPIPIYREFTEADINTDDLREALAQLDGIKEKFPVRLVYCFHLQ